MYDLSTVTAVSVCLKRDPSTVSSSRLRRWKRRAELVAQLALGGRLVFPKGHDEQRLYVVERTDQGAAETMLEPVKFVPLLPGAIRA